MPLWQIYHPSGTFEDHASKADFVRDITKMYTDLGLPAFYVVTHFHKMNRADIFTGEECNENKAKPFVRLVITHIAVHIPDSDSLYARTTSRLDQIVKPHLLDKGYDFEYHVDETERRLWKVNSLIPPQHKSEAEKLWVQENRAVPYDGAYQPSVNEQV